MLSVMISGSLLIPCGVRVEAHIKAEETERVEILEVEKSSTETEVRVWWPKEFEKETNVDWYLRILYGKEMKQVCYTF
jgi:uncharacterized membrane protein YebE (DUF533 family)